MASLVKTRVDNIGLVCLFAPTEFIDEFFLLLLSKILGGLCCLDIKFRFFSQRFRNLQSGRGKTFFFEKEITYKSIFFLFFQVVIEY